MDERKRMREQCESREGVCVRERKRYKRERERESMRERGDGGESEKQIERAICILNVHKVFKRTLI